VSDEAIRTTQGNHEAMNVTHLLVVGAQLAVLEQKVAVVAILAKADRVERVCPQLSQAEGLPAVRNQWAATHAAEAVRSARAHLGELRRLDHLMRVAISGTQGGHQRPSVAISGYRPC
jgi:hypothetical protein